MNETKPKRRWFRFSLLTFLIVVTLLGGWIGWNLNELRDSNQIFDRLKGGGDQIQSYGDDEIGPLWRMAKFPRMWRILGVRPVRSIRLTSAHYSQSDAKLIAEWFPEAEVTFRNQDGTTVEIQ
jgi:hypothetical protein